MEENQPDIFILPSGDESDSDITDDLNSRKSRASSFSTNPRSTIGSPNASELSKIKNKTLPKDVTLNHKQTHANHNKIFGSTLTYLQYIRESVIQMKKATPVQNETAGEEEGPKNGRFSSCPALYDLAAEKYTPFSVKIRQSAKNNNYHQRRSWASTEDPVECSDYNNSNKSVSLSSLESGGREMWRENKKSQIRTRHSDSIKPSDVQKSIERQETLNGRLYLHKSISTPSITPMEASENVHVETPLNFTDSEEETHDETTLLRANKNAHARTGNLPEKRRKRSSLFFRKRKEKNKSKSNSPKSDDPISTFHFYSFNDNIGGDTKMGKMTKFAPFVGSFVYDEMRNINLGEFGDLVTDPSLGIDREEPDSWTPNVSKEILKTLSDSQIKNQEHIYEFIMTEKHHCQTLLVVQKIFIEGSKKHFGNLNIEQMFPRLSELIGLHTDFLRKLRAKQRNVIVYGIADVILDFFSPPVGQRLTNVYGDFCSSHRSSLITFKNYITEDHSFAEWYKICLQNPLLKKKGIPECILFITQRLTKYPLLIDPLLKSSKNEKIEIEKLKDSLALVKEILTKVDARVADIEKENRKMEIYEKLEAKSFAMYKKEKFRKADLLTENRKFQFEGVADLMQGRSKMQSVLVVVLTDCLFFLQEVSQKYYFFTPDNKAGIVPLNKLLIREKAGAESRGIYIISSNPDYPEMYELKVLSPKDKNMWIKAIRNAVITCPTHDDQRFIANDRVPNNMDLNNVHEQICKLREKDIEEAIILTEKLRLQESIFLEVRNAEDNSNVTAEMLLEYLGSYHDLLKMSCDDSTLWKKVWSMIQDIGSLTSTIYNRLTGISLEPEILAMLEKPGQLSTSPTLPRRAETFGGFDEKRKLSIQLKESLFPPSYNFNTKKNQKQDDTDSSSRSPMSVLESELSDDNFAFSDSKYVAFKIIHHLQLLLFVISQQSSTIKALQSELATYKDGSKAHYRHNDQLEELRNLQDKLQEEKIIWLKQREDEQRILDEQRSAQKQIQDQIRKDQEDIENQRNQLYRKMEILSNQGLLLSPNTPLPVPTPSVNHDDNYLRSSNKEFGRSQTMDRRDDKKRQSNIKMGSLNLGAGKSGSKTMPASIKQTIPLKLSSSTSVRSSSVHLVPTKGASNSTSPVTQIFPYKLADKKSSGQTGLVFNHVRTTSSPANIQQQATPKSSTIPTVSGRSTRTNSYPKFDERLRPTSLDGSHKLSPSTVNYPVALPRTTTDVPSNERNHDALKQGSGNTDEEKIIFF